ncbi:MAG TPA: DUF3060 domain-containing protein [Kofleriaceae bacterium]|nr:DUF3060 domain-containing protein [Kofleriaceae bacterium]
MKTFALLALVVLSAPVSADVTVMDNDQTLTVDCAKDKNVNLVGNHIKVTLTGTCTSVKVTGNHATVIGSTTNAFVSGSHTTLTLEAVDTISVSGNKNTVTYKKPIAKKKTAVSNMGKDNSVTQQ